MPPERSQQLVFELDAWYRSHSVRQKDLAGLLHMSPQQLAEILSLRNHPTGEQALQILDFLKMENMEPIEPSFKPTAPENPDRRVVIGNRVVTARLADFIQKRGLLKAKTTKRAKPGESAKPAAEATPALSQSKLTKLKVPLPIEEPAPAVFSQNALAFFNMAVSTLQRVDLRENKRLLLAHHYLKSSGDPFISTINPIELLKEINAQGKQ